MAPIIVIGSLQALGAYNKIEAEGQIAKIEFFRISYKMQDSLNLVLLTCLHLLKTRVRG